MTHDARQEKIVIKTVNRPSKESTLALANWFCDVFDLSGKEDIEPELFKEIVTTSLKGIGITSKLLSEELETPRSTVIYHLNGFINSGLVIRRGRRYFLKGEDLATTLEEMQADMEREFNRLREFASKFDQIVEGEIYAKRKRREEK